ncbi:hypothetical protein EDC18_103352 [Natranaerovirga pectinivora]|uniref:DUF2178 domain-containing protein n=1 Tax=Natranaerovirga pectinivora TaxID=682400 RepID=A0A4R3MNM7_9FIRM|nr:hypothetical protein [Natranaerovirga pectinivora]TCT15644.1 hypothetical protein EDC18_103352 [Natranaerovirga pectinivora]
MNNKNYKKTYKPLIAWIIAFLVITIIIALTLSDVSRKVSVLGFLISMVISLYILFFIIYKGEYVYWINGGPDYEEAKEATSEKRKKYAKAHLDKFLKMMLISFLYSIISLLFNFSTWIDFLLIIMLIIITGISTISIKYDK